MALRGKMQLAAGQELLQACERSGFCSKGGVYPLQQLGKMETLDGKYPDAAIPLNPKHLLEGIVERGKPGVC